MSATLQKDDRRVVVVETTIGFDFGERLRILFGAPAHFRARIELNPTGFASVAGEVCYVGAKRPATLALVKETDE